MGKKVKSERVFSNPFIDDNGQVKCEYRAILDRCILFPTPPPERIGNGVIEVPETVRAQFQDATGTLLSVGPGFWSDDGKWHPTSDQLIPGVKVLFDNTVPWRVIGTGLDGKQYTLVICGVQDICGVL